MLGVVVTQFTGESITYPWTGEVVALPIAFVYILLLGGPFQEEFGWRGYALEPLMDRFGALFGSTLLGIVWGVWHLPWFYMPSMTLYYQRPLIGFLITITLLSVIMAWVFVNTNGSLLVMILMHASFNWAMWAFPAIESDIGGQVVILLLASVVGFIVIRHGNVNFQKKRTSSR